MVNERMKSRSADGHWAFDGDLIRFTYEGVGRKVDEEGNVLLLKRWKSTATYRWENRAVKLVEGKAPQFGYWAPKSVSSSMLAVATTRVDELH